MSNSPFVYIGLPPSKLFRFPSYTELFDSINSSRDHPSFLPVKSHKYYAMSVDALLVITTVIMYVSLVLIANRWNRVRKNQPSPWCESGIFRTIMILHNSFLAVFSATVVYMALRVIQDTFPFQDDQDYEVQVVDYFCKFASPTWTTGRSEMTDGLQRQWSGDPWNNGLGALPWVFYLSKFYELLDTGLILMKGKEASFLQIFDHAGVLVYGCAMLHCMTPQILIPLLVNSGVHSIMVRSNSILLKQ